MRKFKLPVEEKKDLPTLYPGTNAIFSPDEKFIVTGCGYPERGTKGRLLFLDRNGLDQKESVILDSTVVKVVWHPKINQVSLISS